jgi:NTP pyrophosphatase (non-canonical NTP hydrolase)
MPKRHRPRSTNELSQVSHGGMSLNRELNLEKISERLKKFSKDRNWEQYHSPKNLAMALSVEVAELVEIFQWSNDGGTKEIKDPETRKQIEEEIADIFNYLVKFVDLMEIDLEKISLEKIQKNDEKYPVEKSKGKSEKYNKL